MLLDRSAKVAPVAHDGGDVQQLLSPAALEFLESLQHEFGPRRRAMLNRRIVRQRAIDFGMSPGFSNATQSLRQMGWQVAPPPPDLEDRRVEITGPTDRKMIINALNSGASAFMADFEDANSPTWANMIQGQLNLQAAIDRSLTFTSAEGREYRLNDRVATLMVRPRGWHLDERHLLVAGAPMSASFFDFGLYVFHNAAHLLESGSGPYFYLPKLENHLEARLWNDVLEFTEGELRLPHGSIRVTVLIETILAALEMDEILHELRDHIVGLNAGRWDYIFSIIKKFRSLHDPEYLLPDRAQITMTAPFMRAYTDLLVKTCHRRGAHAIGGMAAFIPSRKDPSVNEVALERVRDDKRRESKDGFDGTWVAHPDLVPIAREIFDAALGDQPNQLHRMRSEVHVKSDELLDYQIPGGRITEQGVRTNINIGIQYLEAWLRGNGAVAINNLMEDTATAEICRAQLWQWLHHPEARLDDGRPITIGLYRSLMAEEIDRIQQSRGEDAFHSGGRFDAAIEIFDHLVVDDDFAEFLTLPASERLAEAAGVLR